MKKILQKVLLTALVVALMISIMPSASYATGNADKSVSGNDPSVSGNDPKKKTVAPDFNGFVINFYTGTKPVKSPENFEGSMESQEILFATVSENEKTALKKNTFSLKYYKFTGWHCEYSYNGETKIWDFEDEEEIGNLTEGVQGTLNFYAKWEPVKYKIDYNLETGVTNVDNPEELTIEDEKLVLKAPVKSGFTFRGWYKDSNFNEEVTEIEAKDLADFYEDAEESDEENTYKLFAKWEEIIYTIKFSANGGSGKMNAINNVSYSKSISLPASTFTRRGMTFTGWNTKADGSGKSISDKAKVSKLSSDGKTVTLYAQWKYIKYTISYKGLGSTGVNKNNPKSYTIASGKITFKAPSRPGYTFQGWYTDKNYKKKITSIAAGSTGNVVIYAKWKANKYTLKFNGNGSTSGKMSTMKNILFSDTFKLPANTFVKSGYVFKGWNTKADGSGASYSNKEKVKGLCTKSNGTVTLYAQWKVVKYNIKFDGNGATSGKTYAMKNLVYGKTYKLNENKFKRTGYRFMGWNTQKDGKGTTYKDLQKVKNLASKDGQTVVLYAKWLKKITKTYTDKELFDYFVNDGMTIQGAAGLLGNLKAESDLRANNLQNIYNESLRMTDEEYTEAVDNGTYTNFVYDQAGYGLAQWTSPGRKQKLLEYAQYKECSIADTQMQLEFLIYELAYNYNGVYKVLQTTKSVKAASNKVLLDFEKPRDQSTAAQQKRAAIGTSYFKTFCPNDKPEQELTMKDEDCPFIVQVDISNLSIRSGPGTNNSRLGFLAAGKYKIVHVKSGEGSSKGWGQLDGDKGWIALDYATRIE